MDKSRRNEIGLIAERCAHRSVSLAYGIPADDGLRCEYHGWVYGADGRCLEQPFEEMEHQNANFKGPDPHQLLTRCRRWAGWSSPTSGRPRRSRCCRAHEVPGSAATTGEFIEADDSSIGGGGPQIVPCNWLQHFENVVDPYPRRRPARHASAGTQFVRG